MNKLVIDLQMWIKLPDWWIGITSLVSSTPSRRPRTLFGCRRVPNGSFACNPTWFKRAFDRRTIWSEAVATVLRTACCLALLSASKVSDSGTFEYVVCWNLLSGGVGHWRRPPDIGRILQFTKLSTSRDVTLELPIKWIRNDCLELRVIFRILPRWRSFVAAEDLAENFRQISDPLISHYTIFTEDDNDIDFLCTDSVFLC